MEGNDDLKFILARTPDGYHGFMCRQYVLYTNRYGVLTGGDLLVVALQATNRLVASNEYPDYNWVGVFQLVAGGEVAGIKQVVPGLDLNEVVNQIADGVECDDNTIRCLEAYDIESDSEASDAWVQSIAQLALLEVMVKHLPLTRDMVLEAVGKAWLICYEEAEAFDAEELE